VKRAFYLGLGLLFIGFAVIGVLLPVVPSVPFLIVAAFCFARSHPAWAQRLYEHPVYGPSLRDWRDRGAIDRRAKYAAIVGMTIGVVFTAATVGAPLLLIPLGVLAIVGPWIWTRPE
jgi:uncharacterized protein